MVLLKFTLRVVESDESNECKVNLLIKLTDSSEE